MLAIPLDVYVRVGAYSALEPGSDAALAIDRLNGELKSIAPVTVGERAVTGEAERRADDKDILRRGRQRRRQREQRRENERLR